MIFLKMKRGRAESGEFQEIEKFREVKKSANSINFKVSIRALRFSTFAALLRFVMAGGKITESLGHSGSER